MRDSNSPFSALLDTPAQAPAQASARVPVQASPAADNKPARRDNRPLHEDQPAQRVDRVLKADGTSNSMAPSDTRTATPRDAAPVADGDKTADAKASRQAKDFKDAKGSEDAKDVKAKDGDHQDPADAAPPAGGATVVIADQTGRPDQAAAVVSGTEIPNVAAPPVRLGMAAASTSAPVPAPAVAVQPAPNARTTPSNTARSGEPLTVAAIDDGSTAPIQPGTPAGPAAVFDAAAKPEQQSIEALNIGAAAPNNAKAAKADDAKLAQDKPTQDKPAAGLLKPATENTAATAHDAKQDADGDDAARPRQGDAANAVGAGKAHATAPDANTHTHARPADMTAIAKAASDAAQPLAAASNTQSVTAAAPANATPAPTGSANAMAVPLAGVPIAITTQALAGKNRFEIRLDPPELGRIDVRLDLDHNGHVTSRLVVDRVDTLDLLRRDAPQLQRALQDAGLKTSDQGMQFSLRDQGYSGQSDNSAVQQAATTLTISDDATAPLDALKQGYGRLIGLGGGLDIRV